MSTARGMKENRRRKGSEKINNGVPVKKPLNPIQVDVGGGRPEVSREFAVNDVEGAYERVYHSLSTAGARQPPVEEIIPRQESFQPSIPIPIDKTRFLAALKIPNKSSLKHTSKRASEVSVGNWTLEEVWRERAIQFTEPALDFPQLEASSCRVNHDPNLSPEELRAFGLAPRSYDYLFENLEGFDEGTGGEGGEVAELVTQPQLPLPQPSTSSSHIAIPDAWASLDEVMKGIEGMNFSYFTEFPGDFLVVNYPGDVTHKPRKWERMGRQTSGGDTRKDLRYGR